MKHRAADAIGNGIMSILSGLGKLLLLLAVAGPRLLVFLFSWFFRV